MTLLGSLLRVLTASDVEVPLGQNLETCVNPRARWYMAEGRFVARSVSRSQSLLSSAPASREPVSWGYVFRQSDFSTPTSALPMKLFLWAEPRPTRLLSVHTLSAYLFCHMKKISWQTSIRVIIIHYDANG